MERCGQKLVCLKGVVGTLRTPGAEPAFEKLFELKWNYQEM